MLLVNLSGAFILLTVFSFLMSIMLAALYAVKSLSSHRKERNYREKYTLKNIFCLVSDCFLMRGGTVYIGQKGYGK